MTQITDIISVCITMFTAVMTQRVILTSPQPEDLQNLCPGEEVNIICEIWGSHVIAWSSVEYIGQGNRFELDFF